MLTTQIRCGFRSRKQLPWFMVWKEYYHNSDDNDPYYAKVLFNSLDWIGR